MHGVGARARAVAALAAPIMLALAGCGSAGGAQVTTGTVTRQSTAPTPHKAPIIDAGVAGATAWTLTAATLAVSTDAGATWHTEPLPAGVAGGAVLAVSAQPGRALLLVSPEPSGFAVFRQAAVGGAWTSASYQPSTLQFSGQARTPGTVRIAEAPGGFVALSADIDLTSTGAIDNLFTSHDDGRTFTDAFVSYEQPWLDLAFSSALTGVVLAGQARQDIETTSDGGAHWADVPTPGTHTWTSVLPVGGTLEVLDQPVDTPARLNTALGHAGVASAGEPVAPANAGAVVTSSGGHLAAVTDANGGELLTSDDHGATWRRRASPQLPAGVTQLSIAGPDSYLATTENGACRSFKSDCSDVIGVWSSEDGGLTWLRR